MPLPSGSLYARGFASDAGTLRALRAGLADHKAKIQRGRLAVALRALASEPASKILFVDLDGVKEPETAGRELAAVCAFETAVIAIGSTDTAHFTRTLFQHGVADYLLKPISPALVREVCASVTDDLPERSYAGRVIAFSGSAGSGTSTLVVAVARALAAEGRTASVVDLDPISGRLPSLLGVEPADGLAALLTALGSGEPADTESGFSADQVDRVCAPVDAGLSVVAHAPADSLPQALNVAAVGTLLEHLANRTHVVLVTGFPDPDSRLEIMQRADARVLLYEPTLSSLSEAVRSLALLGTKCPATLVQCLSRAPRSALSSSHIRYALGDRRPDIVIPFDGALHAAATGQKIRRPGRAYRSAVRRVFERVMENAAVAPGV